MYNEKTSYYFSCIGSICAAGAANALTPTHFIAPTHYVKPAHIVVPAHVVFPSFGSNTVTALCSKNGLKSDCKVYVNCTGKEVVVHADGWVNDVTLQPQQVAIDGSTATSLNVYNANRQFLATLAVKSSDSLSNSLYAIANKYGVVHINESTHCGL